MEGLAGAVMEVYRDIDLETALFRSQTGLMCPRGCGICCESLEVEATLLEALPMAYALIAKGMERYALENLEAKAARGDQVCLFYNPSPEVSGHCSGYEYRPLVCRLFGFAGRIGKDHVPVFSPCKRVRELNPVDSASALVAVSRGIKIPIFSDFFMRVSTICPTLGLQIMPINEAFQKAIEYLALRVTLAQQ